MNPPKIRNLWSHNIDNLRADANCVKIGDTYTMSITCVNKRMEAQPDERQAKRSASVLEWYDRHRANNIWFKRRRTDAFLIFCECTL